MPDHVEQVGLLVNNVATGQAAIDFISQVWGKWPEGTTFTASQMLT